ncbi:MAG: sigma 54-interacting transcriptional regulator [Silvibacterium sp.]|nr:sigma 54-interacting transcriptional regulator [Silvibacterium sp.]
MSNEHTVRRIVDVIPGLIITATAEGATESVNQQLLEYFGKTPEALNNWAVSDAIHPEDRPHSMDAWRHSLQTGYPYDVEHRLCDVHGTYRWFHLRGLPARDAEGRIIRWNILLTDIEDRKQAEEKLRRNETDLMEARRLTRELQCERDRLRLLLDLNNCVASDLDLRQVFRAISSEIRRIFKCDFVGLASPDRTGKQMRQHMIDFPGSKGLMREGALYPIEGSLSGNVFRSAMPLVLNSLTEGNSIWNSDPAFYRRVTEEGPFKSGCFLPLVSGNQVLGVLQLTSRDEHSFADHDIEFLTQVANQIAISLKNALLYEHVNKTKDRLHDENMALREQIDGACMFEEIVGSSPQLQDVLTSVVKVSATDSTILILGETGTGKELIARATHKCSRRSGHAFISVNCASIPPSLIASELFGHEKGAFTGALQQRQGRFEQAHSGTIFLDEIGELPAETQIALLRVLQERQFERVGGNRVIPTDVRIIAATNRDLPAAIAAGTFRADLFYRLNVFPIEMPSLRERKEDIPMLIEHFVKRFAERMGKQIRKIDKKTLERCQNYTWPGNIRELQNIVERSVILLSGDTFWIDEAWLSNQQPTVRDLSGSLAETLENQEKKIIEAALAESNGKVAGPTGAAARLGIPRSTLDRKILQLNINKHRFMPRP